MRYFYLKLGKGNSLAVEWLKGKNPLGRPAAVIFFGHCSVEDIRNGHSDRQAKDFYESSLSEARNQTLITVIGQGTAWFLKPAGELIEHESPTDTGNLWKIMPVEIVSSQRLNKIPPVCSLVSTQMLF